MSEWAPVLVGFGIISLFLAGARILPHSWVSGELRQWYGAKPTGPYLALTRRDQIRRALLSAIAAVVLVASGSALFPIAERFPNESRTHLTLEAYFFIAFILGGVAALAAVVAVFHAVLWRPKRVRLTDAGRLDLATYLALLSEGTLEHRQWRDFSAVCFEDDEIEAVRRAFVQRIGSVPRELSDSDVAWLRQSADRLLEAAV
jgi:hypothetical protein